MWVVTSAEFRIAAAGPLLPRGVFLIKALADFLFQEADFLKFAGDAAPVAGQLDNVGVAIPYSDAAVPAPRGPTTVET
jgi:hypothetical protein